MYSYILPLAKHRYHRYTEVYQNLAHAFQVIHGFSLCSTMRKIIFKSLVTCFGEYDNALYKSKVNLHLELLQHPKQLMQRYKLSTLAPNLLCNKGITKYKKQTLGKLSFFKTSKLPECYKNALQIYPLLHIDKKDSRGNFQTNKTDNVEMYLTLCIQKLDYH